MIRFVFQDLQPRTLRFDRLRTFAVRYPERMRAALKAYRDEQNAETVRMVR